MGGPKTAAEILELADTLQQRAEGGWNTRLSPDTTLLVVQALKMYAPKPPEPPLPKSPISRFRVDMFASGSTVYRLASDDEILEIVAWAQSSLVAHAAFDELIGRYPRDRFMQKRRAWVEREPDER